MIKARKMFFNKSGVKTGVWFVGREDRLKIDFIWIVVKAFMMFGYDSTMRCLGTALSLYEKEGGETNGDSFS